jgi:hypothetical protein
MSDDWSREQHERRMAEEHERLNEASRKSMFDQAWRNTMDVADEYSRKNSAFTEGAHGHAMPSDSRYWADFHNGAALRGTDTGRDASIESTDANAYRAYASTYAGPAMPAPCSELPEELRAQFFNDGFFGVCLDFRHIGRLEAVAVSDGYAAFFASLDLGSADADLAKRTRCGETYSPFHWRRTYHPIRAMMAAIEGSAPPDPRRTSEGARWCFARGLRFAAALHASQALEAEHSRRASMNWLTRWYVNSFRPIGFQGSQSDLAHAKYLLYMQDWYSRPENIGPKTGSQK